MDGDGDADLLFAAESDSIFWCNNTNQTRNTEWPCTEIYDWADDAVAVFAADMDGDGDTDALSASIADHVVAWYV